jgi:hypothetical protein
MADLQTTVSKLRSTPTGGGGAEHSSAFRDAASAGYKGYIQGTIAGGTFYGLLGAVIGLCVAVPLAVFAPVAVGAAAFTLIPAMAGLGIWKGAGTFGEIGRTAAIQAQIAESNEHRRILIDRYFETPSDKEAELIYKQLNAQYDTKPPASMFHWKTVLVCAAIGAALSFGLLSFAPLTALIGGESAASGFLAGLGLEALATKTGIMALGTTVGTALGGLAGAAIGIDRYYVRRMFDYYEDLLHDGSAVREKVRERQLDAERLAAAALEDTVIVGGKQVRLSDVSRAGAPALAANDNPKEPYAIAKAKTIAALDEVPQAKVTSAQLERRLAALTGEGPALGSAG